MKPVGEEIADLFTPDNAKEEWQLQVLKEEFEAKKSICVALRKRSFEAKKTIKYLHHVVKFTPRVRVT